jgi:competence transcription factor ComK
MTHIIFHSPYTFVFDKTSKTYKHHIIYIIDKIMMHEFKTFHGYMKAFSQYYPNMYLKPIIISEQLILIPMFGYKALDNIVINYIQIRSIEKNGDETIIVFHNNEVIHIKKSYQAIMKQIQTVKKIISDMKSFSYKDFI